MQPNQKKAQMPKAFIIYMCFKSRLFVIPSTKIFIDDLLRLPQDGFTNDLQ